MADLGYLSGRANPKGTEINCQVWIKNGDKEKALIACRAVATENMELVRLSDDIAAVLG